ncbi:acyl-CoA dehydrogenase family protein [Paenibacillus solisilvae]|uniref:Acyl-CoA dehydrogenase family protein n=1 Tax=Paenibacillus solisilvae TaxID=2486751 RepID=A0ABW0VWC7_9BACL
MKFGFTEEQEMIREMAARFAEREIRQQAGSLDESERFDRPVYDRMAELGFTGLPWPESEGGSGAGFLSLTIVLEELSIVNASMAAALWSHVCLAAWPIYRFGQRELKLRYWRKLAEGQLLGAGMLPQMLGERSSLRVGVIAWADGDGYVLEGLQKYVFGGTEADVFVVYALMGEEKGANRRKRYHVFLVEKGSAGLEIIPAARKLGLRSSGMAHLKFEQCRLVRAQRIGREGQGGAIARMAEVRVRYGLAAIAAGIVNGASASALVYAQERNQFGKPIARHQAIAFALADMHMAAEASKLLAYQAAWREDEGLADEDRAVRALHYAADAAVKSAIQAIQIFGGYGYTKDYPVERYLRDAKAVQLAGGLGSVRRR